MERRNSVAGELRHLETPSSGNAQGRGTCLSYFGRMWPRWYTSSRGRLSVIFTPTPRASKSASVLLNKLFLRSAEDLPASLSHSLASELSCANELGQSRAGSGTGMPLLAASSRARWLFFHGQFHALHALQDRENFLRRLPKPGDITLKKLEPKNVKT